MADEKQKSDDDLVNEVVEKMRERNPNHFEAEHTMSCIAEVFGDREPPGDIISRVAGAFCA